MVPYVLALLLANLLWCTAILGIALGHGESPEPESLPSQVGAQGA